MSKERERSERVYQYNVNQLYDLLAVPKAEHPEICSAIIFLP